MGRSLGLLLLGTFVAAAQDATSARTLLHEVADAYNHVQGYQMEVITIDRVAGTSGDFARRDLFIAYGAPDRLRIEDKDKKDIKAFHDRGVSYARQGTVMFLSAPVQRAAPPLPMGEDRPLGPDESLPMPGAIIPPRQSANKNDDDVNDASHRKAALVKMGLIDYTDVEKNLKSARVLKDEQITVGEFPVPCTVIEATYSHGETRTFWVDTRNHDVVREVDLMHGEGANRGKQVEHTVTMRSLVWDQPSDESLFNLRHVFGTSPAEARFAATHPALIGGIPPHLLRGCSVAIDTEESKIAHLRGTVSVAFVVGTDGTPAEIQVKQGVGLGIDELAVHCVSLSQFEPAQKDGKPIEWKVGQSFQLANDFSTDWSLARADFQLEPGTTRPVFVKTTFPGTHRAQARVEVPVHLTIDKHGVPRDVQVVGAGTPKIDQDAVKMVSSWRFRPGEKDGAPVEVPATFILVWSEHRTVVLPLSK